MYILSFNHVLLFLTKGKAHNVLYKISCKVEEEEGVKIIRNVVKWFEPI